MSVKVYRLMDSKELPDVFSPLIHRLFGADGGNMRGSDANLTMSGSMTVDMTATNTARINIQVLGASKDIDIQADNSHFSGFLVC